MAKLKAQLREEPAPPPKKVIPKPLEAAPRSIEDEDALFLAMMGRAKSPAPAPTPVARAVEERPAPVVEAPPKPVAADFHDALAGLKGLKRMETDPLLAAALAPAAMAPQAPQPDLPPPEAVALPVTPEPEALAPAAEAVRPGLPQRIQLAAGMAIEVDGSLDLKGHSLQDALERLKDRTADAQYLRWRSLLVNFGPSADLHEGFLTLVSTGGLPSVTRFAQAPIPMGGTQAWVLYLQP
ncbi:MAG TPA: hypothetical protein VJ505_08635 [Holophagaceae bacterium]|nr:hypothetical protein [Holophagaceae bacterium]